MARGKRAIGALRSGIHAAERDRRGDRRLHFPVHVWIGDAAEEILELAREVGADLIIAGRRGLRGIERVVPAIPQRMRPVAARRKMCR